jgi:hypothetical protein
MSPLLFSSLPHTPVRTLQVFLYMYTKLYVAFNYNSGQRGRDEFTVLETDVTSIQGALTSAFALQLGFLLIVPIFVVVGVERGLSAAVSSLVYGLLRLNFLFYVFGTGTNSYWVNAAITQSAAAYKVRLSHHPPCYATERAVCGEVDSQSVRLL